MKLTLPFDFISLRKWIAYRAPLPATYTSQEHSIIIIHKTETDINYFYITSQIDDLTEKYKYDANQYFGYSKSCRLERRAYERKVLHSLRERRLILYIIVRF